MANSHADALKMIDGQLLPMVKNADLQKHLALLSKVREDVVAHLAQLQA